MNKSKETTIPSYYKLHTRSDRNKYHFQLLELVKYCLSPMTEGNAMLLRELNKTLLIHGAKERRKPESEEQYKEYMDALTREGKTPLDMNKENIKEFIHILDCYYRGVYGDE